MATLKDLCSSVPQSLLRVQANYEVAKRAQASYNKRMDKLGVECAIFEQCKRNRTQKRVRNTWSTEQAGRVGTSCIHENRFSGSYIHVVSKSRIK